MFIFTMGHLGPFSFLFNKFTNVKRTLWQISNAKLKCLPRSDKLVAAYLAAKKDKTTLKLTPPAHALLLHRFYAQDFTPQKLKLMDYDLLIWPSFIKTIKNWIFTALIIRPYMDPEFNLSEFIEGSKHAAEVVSGCLAEGKLDQLTTLLSPECLVEVQRHLGLLSVAQRHELAVIKKDIYFSFPYELGILFDDSKEGQPQARHVEVTVVHHVLRGHSEMIERGDPIPLNIGVTPEFRERIYILNYRFIKNFTKGVTDQWTLNVVNHFKPTEHA